MSIDQAIRDYVGQVLSNSSWSDEQKAQAIRDQAARVGVSPEQIASATGYGLDTVKSYMALAPQTTPSAQEIAAAEQQARQAWINGEKTPTSTLNTLYRVTPDGTVTRVSDGYSAPYSLNDIQNPDARAYFEANPQELFGFGSLSQGPFKNAGVRNTNRKMGQLTPDDWYKGYMSGFPEGWDAGGGAGGGMAGAAQRPGAVSGGGAGTGSPGSGSSSSWLGGGSGLSTAQQALLKALMDQAERDSITGEIRDNASELYDRTQAYEQDALGDIALFTGGNRGIYNRYGDDIENDVATAVADARAGQTQALNTAARQAARYGISMPVSLAGVSTQQATQLAAAANSTRNNAINNYRNLVGQGIGLKEGTFRTSQAATADSMGRAEAASMGNRNMRIQDESLDWAKRLDVTGMARGMPGASQGAYGVAVGAGNSAVQNQMAPGQALIGAMGQANNTTMQGRQLAMQGLTGILNAQTDYANTVANQDNGLFGAIGTIGSAAIAKF